jgi:hypothetical protein
MADKQFIPLIVAATLTAFFGVLAGAIAVWGPSTFSPGQALLLDACITMFTGGGVAIFALLHGERP